jgi:UDP-N-acetylglucosamine transferase subunit ALG13
LVRYGEAVDDHQLEFATRASEAGFVTLVEDTDTLVAAIAGQQDSPPPPPRPDDRLVADLRGFLAEATGRDGP